MFSAPVVLKALTTRAPLAAAAICSAPDVVVPRLRPARPGAVKAPAELAGYELLRFSGGSHRYGWRLSNGRTEERVDGAARLRINNSFAVRDAAIRGLGIAQLPLAIASEAVAAGTLRRVLPDWEPQAVPVHAVFPSTRYLTPKVRVFIDLAAAAFGANTAA